MVEFDATFVHALPPSSLVRGHRMAHGVDVNACCCAVGLSHVGSRIAII